MIGSEVNTKAMTQRHYRVNERQSGECFQSRALQSEALGSGPVLTTNCVTFDLSGKLSDL